MSAILELLVNDFGVVTHIAALSGTQWLLLRIQLVRLYDDF
jgi:hypothetical protein